MFEEQNDSSTFKSSTLKVVMLKWNDFDFYLIAVQQKKECSQFLNQLTFIMQDMP